MAILVPAVVPHVTGVVTVTRPTPKRKPTRRPKGDEPAKARRGDWFETRVIRKEQP